MILIFKNDASTMEGVLANSMHATNSRPLRAVPGELILIYQTKSSLKPGEKPIRYVMDFVSCSKDVNDDSVRIWGKKWDYLIKCENLRPVKPFDITDIQVSDRKYGSIQTFGYVDEEDEPLVLDWIGGIPFFDSTMDVDLSIGEELTKEEIEDKFNTNFGSRIKGITLRVWEDGTPYIILFSRADGPYSDKIEGRVLYYDGEGQNKDQELTPANNALIKANEIDRTIYGFRQNEKGKWVYMGVLEVLDYSYIPKEGFMTYEFKLQQTGLEIPEILSFESKEVVELVKDEPKLKDESTYDTVKRKRRNDAFRKLVKQIYNNTCAVCGKRRFTNAGNPEVEAAHIYPKSKDGTDDLRNGISLCKLHHWAFDNGLFAINDDYSIKVKDWIKRDRNYEEIYFFENLKINLPEDERFRPDSIYLNEHRKNHGFDR